MRVRSCRDVRADLSAYLDGDLDAGLTGATRAHLEGCESCRSELDLLRVTVGALRLLPDLPPPAAILAGVRARLRPEPWYRRLLEGRQWLLGLPVGALATLLVVVGVSLFQARYPRIGRMVAKAPVVPVEQNSTALRQAAGPTPPSAARGDLPPTISRAAPRRQLETPEVKKSANREKSAVITPNIGLQDHIFATIPTRQVAKEEPQTPTSRVLPPPPERGDDFSKKVGAEDSLRGEELAAAPPPVVLLEPAIERTVVLDEVSEGLAVRARDSRLLRSTVVVAPEGKPGMASPMPAEKDDAPASSHDTNDRAGSKHGTLRGAQSAMTEGKEIEGRMSVAPSRVRPSQPASTAGAEIGFRSVGSPPVADQAVPPGTIGQRQIRVVCLLPPNGDTMEDLPGLLRREGAGDIAVRVLEPLAIREAFAPYRGRLGFLPEPSRGWTVTASVPQRALTRLLNVLTSRTSLRILEQPNATIATEDSTEPLGLRITVFR